LRRRRVPGRRLAALSVAGAVTLIAFAAATAGVNYRYAVPSLPLLVLGTALATAPGGRTSRKLPKTSRLSTAPPAAIDLTALAPQVVSGRHAS
jgi:hypothetical protein